MLKAWWNYANYVSTSLYFILHLQLISHGTIAFMMFLILLFKSKYDNIKTILGFQLFCFDAASGYCVSYRPAAEGSRCGDGQVNKQTKERTNKQKNKQKNKQTKEQT